MQTISTKIAFLALLLVIFSSFVVQNDSDNINKDDVNGYYRSFNDFKAHKLVKMDESLGWLHVMTTFYIRYKNGGKHEKVKCSDMWGFVFRNRLFRIDHNDVEDDPYAVVSAGKIVYYENGYAYINAMVSKSEKGVASFGHLYCFSKTLNSPIISVSSVNQYKAFETNNKSTYKKLFDCIDNSEPSTDLYKNCVEEYNKTDADSSGNH